jgi:nicotinamidase-related amidase
VSVAAATEIMGQIHGLFPDRSPVALLVLDMVSDFQFPDGPKVQRAARRIAGNIADLKRRAKQAGIACIYVNDSPGRWRSDSRDLIERCLLPRAPGADIVSLLRPEASDYFILKPRHSGFYATPLEVLLMHLGTRRLILTGVSSHQCVLFTATDAHVRDLELIVPSDCISGPTARSTRFALEYFSSVLGARVTPSRKLRLAALRKRGSKK